MERLAKEPYDRSKLFIAYRHAVEVYDHLMHTERVYSMHTNATSLETMKYCKHQILLRKKIIYTYIRILCVISEYLLLAFIVNLAHIMLL